MQMIVLGMHRSGTSAVTRLVNLMGAYIGNEEALLPPNDDNPKGYWERRDIADANDLLLNGLGVEWDKLAQWGQTELKDDDLDKFDQIARTIVSKLDLHRPWVLKDPRMCLALPYWLKMLDCPICIIVYRYPVEVAKSLQKRMSMPLSAGLALWEQYNLLALRATAELPRIFVNYNELIADPVAGTTHLWDQLRALGENRLQCPHGIEIGAFLDTRLNRQSTDLMEQCSFVSASQWRLLEMLQQGAFAQVQPAEVPALSSRALEDMREYESRHALLLQTIELHGSNRVLHDSNQELTAANNLLTLQASEMHQAYEVANQELTAANNLLTSQASEMHQAYEVAKQEIFSYRQELEQTRLLRQDTLYLSNLAETLAWIIDETKAQWWWQLGLDLRRLAGVLRLKKTEPRYPYRHVPELMQGLNDWKRTDAARRSKPAHTAESASLHHAPQGLTGVLYVYGDEAANNPSYRYRVIQAVDALKKLGYSADYFHIRDLQPAGIEQLDLSPFNVIVCFRLRTSKGLDALDTLARKNKLLLVYDIDDLVFDSSYEEISVRLGLASAEQSKLQVRQNKEVISRFRFATCTTPSLKRSLEIGGLRHVDVIPNMVSDEVAELSGAAWEMAQRKKAQSDQIVIGYASGTNTHKYDFNCALAAVVSVMKENERVVLHVVGPLWSKDAEIPAELRAFGARVVRKPAVMWPQLPALLAEFDVNLAPLENTPFCEAKSALKFLEAAFVRVPTVASPRCAFLEAIQHGETGFLAESEEEWTRCLRALAEDKELREKIGNAAYTSVRHACTTDVMATRIAKTLTRWLNELRSGSLGAGAGLRSVATTESYSQADAIRTEDELLETDQPIHSIPSTRVHPATFRITSVAGRVKQQLMEHPIRFGVRLARALPRPIKQTIRELVQGDQRSAEAQPSSTPGEYDHWIRLHELSASDLQEQKHRANALSYRPLISIITPVFNLATVYLGELIDSVLAQTYDNWELILGEFSDDPVKKAALSAFMGRYANEPRIKFKSYTENGGISRNSNLCLKESTGEYIALLDHDDTLSPDALYENALKLNECDYDFIYSDKDTMTADGRRFNPLFKPQWSPEMMYKVNYPTHLNLLKRAVVDAVGGFDPTTDGAQDWDIFFKVTERAKHIGHIPKVLYHWRVIPSSVASSINSKPYALAGQRVAVNNHFGRIGLKGVKAYHGENPDIALDWSETIIEPLDVIILSTDQRNLVHLAGQLTLELKGVPDAVVHIAHNYDLKLEALPESFKSAKPIRYQQETLGHCLNESLRGSTRNRLFLSDDLSIRAAGWIQELSGWLNIAKVGAAGIKIVCKDGTIKDIGRIFNLSGTFGNLFFGEGRHTCVGLLGYPDWTRNLIAVSPKCFMVKGSAIAEIGELASDLRDDEIFLDQFLRLHGAGYRAVYTSQIVAEDSGAAIISLAPSSAMLTKIQSHAKLLEQGDPYYNPNLSLTTLRPKLALTVAEKEKSRRNYTRALIASHTFPQGSVNEYGQASLYFGHAMDVTAAALAANQRIVSGPLPASITTAAWFVPPFGAVYAGVYNILHFANFLAEQHGVENRFYLVTDSKSTMDERKALTAAFPSLRNSTIQTVHADSIQSLPAADIGICTQWTTAYMLVQFQRVSAKYYFIQDYETSFYPSGTIGALAENTYHFGFKAIANTEGLAKLYSERFRGQAIFLPSVVDLSKYHATDTSGARLPYRVFFYARPNVERNAFELGAQALVRLKADLGSKVEIYCAGSDWDPGDFGLSDVLTNLGKLPYGDLPAFYQSLHAGLVLMFSYHPGVVPSELMASGVPVVVNNHHEFTWNKMYTHEETALVAFPTASEIARQLRRALENNVLREKVIKGGNAMVAELYSHYPQQAGATWEFMLGIR